MKGEEKDKAEIILSTVIRQAGFMDILCSSHGCYQPISSCSKCNIRTTTSLSNVGVDICTSTQSRACHDETRSTHSFNPASYKRRHCLASISTPSGSLAKLAFFCAWKPRPILTIRYLVETGQEEEQPAT